MVSCRTGGRYQITSYVLSGPTLHTGCDTRTADCATTYEHGTIRAPAGDPPGVSSARRYARGLRYWGQSASERCGHGARCARPTRAPAAVYQLISSGCVTPAIVNAESSSCFERNNIPAYAPRSACARRPRSRNDAVSATATRRHRPLTSIAVSRKPANGASAARSRHPTGSFARPLPRVASCTPSTPMPTNETSATAAATTSRARLTPVVIE